MKILVGADPEVFVRDKKGRSRSAHGLIPGTKEEPFPVLNGAVQVDGMALEFNIHPAATPEEFQNNIESVLSQMEEMVPEYTLDISPTATFHGNHMRAQPKEALELGCEPDYNAYTMQENPRPNASANFRTGAGHVHLGFCEGANPKDPEHMMRCALLVKHLDLFLGLPSLDWDKDVKRRKLYGAAGAFRPKPYGCEYRTLSNAWLKRPELIRYVFEQCQAAVDSLLSGVRLAPFDEDEVREAINSSNCRYYARMALQGYGVSPPPVLEG